MTKSVVYVVPSERHVERILRAGGHAVTRSRMFQKILAALAPKMVVATPEERRMALSEVIDRAAAEHRVLADLGSGARVQMLQVMERAIRDLRAWLITPAMLKTAERESSRAGDRARLLAHLTEALDDRLKQAKLVDPDVAPLLLARLLSKADIRTVAAAVGGQHVVARAIVGWTPAELRWWRALDERLLLANGSAKIELFRFEQPLDAALSRSPLDAIVDRVARALDEAPALVVVPARIGDMTLRARHPDLDPARIEITACLDGRSEAASIAQRVRDGLKSGIAIETIAVAIPAPDADSVAAIRAALELEGIPISDRLAGTNWLDDSGVGRAVRQLVSVAEEGLSRQAVAALLRSPYLRLAFAEDAEGERFAIARALEETPLARAEDVSQAIGLTVSAWRPSDPASGSRGEWACAIAERLLRMASARTWRERLTATRNLAIEFGLHVPGSSGWARDDSRSRLDQAKARAAARDAQAIELFRAALERVEAAMLRVGAADKPVEFAEFLNVVEKSMAELAIPATGSRMGAVALVSLTEIAVEPLSLLIVCNMQEGRMPSSEEPDRVLGPVCQSLMRGRSALDLPGPSIRRAEEQAALLLATASTEAIAFTYKQRDEAGGLLFPAPLLPWLERLGARRKEPVVPHRRRRTVSEALRQSVQRRARIERAREGLFEATRRTLQPVHGALEQNGAVEHVLLEETGGGTRPISVTALERFATCAFRGFASHVLGASEPPAFLDVPDARETGTLLHGALAAAFTETRAMWEERPRNAEEIQEASALAIDRYIANASGSSELRGATLARIRRDAFATITLALDEPWNFFVAEKRFGDGKETSWPAFVIESATGPVQLRGSMDRIDQSHDGRSLRVIDYKSSEDSARTATKSLGETAFQLAIYGAVASDALDKANAEALYLPARARALEHPVRKEKALGAARTIDEEMLTKVRTKVGEVIGAVRAGVFAPIPADERACETCGIDGGCRKPRFVIRGLMEDDVQPDVT